MTTYMTEAHPVASTFLKNAVENGSRLIVVDPRRQALAEFADIFAQIKVGSDIAILNGIMHVLIKEELYDKEFVEQNCSGFEDFKKHIIKNYSPKKASEISGVSVEKIRAIAHLLSSVKPCMVCYTLGITEHTCGRNNVVSVARTMFRAHAIWGLCRMSIRAINRSALLLQKRSSKRHGE